MQASPRLSELYWSSYFKFYNCYTIFETNEPDEFAWIMSTFIHPFHIKFQIKNSNIFSTLNIHSWIPQPLPPSFLPIFLPTGAGAINSGFGLFTGANSQTDKNARPSAWPWGPWSRPRWWNDHKKHSLRRQKWWENKMMVGRKSNKQVVLAFLFLESSRPRRPFQNPFWVLNPSEFSRIF